MNRKYDIDLTRMLPPSLREDKSMLAIANAIQDELLETIDMARLTIVYARIDELPEEILDILAYDLHVDWYDYSYPIDAKREIIKSSTRAHKRLGTKYAVETALGALHPNSYIEEWFQYDGEPFSFRVILDTTNSRVTADPLEIKKAINMYKRMTAHMDDIVYQCTIDIGIGIEKEKNKYRSKLAGRTTAGTHPNREVIGGVEGLELDLETIITDHRFNSGLTGTRPYRNRIAALRDKEIELDSELKDYNFTSKLSGRGQAGEAPQRETKGRNQPLGLEVENEMEAFKFNSRLAGAGKRRNIEANLESNGIIPEATITGYKYNYKLCGKIVTKNK